MNPQAIRDGWKLNAAHQNSHAKNEDAKRNAAHENPQAKMGVKLNAANQKTQRGNRTLHIRFHQHKGQQLGDGMFYLAAVIFYMIYYKGAGMYYTIHYMGAGMHYHIYSMAAGMNYTIYYMRCLDVLYDSLSRSQFSIAYWGQALYKLYWGAGVKMDSTILQSAKTLLLVPDILLIARSLSLTHPPLNFSIHGTSIIS